MASIERIGKYLLLRSNALVNGEAKLPTTTQLEEGELALNFHDGVEKISIKNDNNEIVTFSSDDQVKAWISAGGGGTGGTVNGITGITMNGNAVSVSNYVANLGTVLTSFTETQLSTGTTSGNGNVVTNISVNNHQITLTKGLTIPSWATATTKPTYTASEVGALPTGTTLDDIADGTTRKLSNYATQANFTAHTGDTSVHFTTGDVKTQIEAYGYTTNTGTVTGIKMNGASKGTSGVVDLGTVITGETQLSTGTTTGNGNVVTDISVSNHQITMSKSITIPSWATASTKPSYTASEVGALPTGTTLDNVADGTTRKLSNYATQANFTAHTGNTNIHVTTAQTAAWDAKQDAISDLETIRSNASAGAAKVSNVQADWNATSGLAQILNKPTAISAFTEDASHRTVTDTEKTTWNNKQAAISDLTTIRNNASSGATAYTNVTAHTNNSDIHVTATQKTNWNTAYNNRITGVTFTSGTTNSATISSNKLNITGATVPTYSASDSGKVLSVNSSGQLVWITPVTIYTGTTAPNNSQGIDGDIYLQTS